MPLRRNRRQYEQLTDFDRSRKIGLKEAVVTEGRVYRRGGSGRPRNTNDREDRAIRRVATSAPTTLLASIQRHLPPSRHPVPSRETIRETNDRSWLEEQTSAKTLTTDPHYRQCRLDFCRPRAKCDRLETCHLQ
ncbi:HTH_Tnp_Tc3_2 domain-containing protein [Trichonephila clavipes]|nr:HTH_Tnp_Tc3_2 domain-containing protein [Trichonephila clavipes]